MLALTGLFMGSCSEDYTDWANPQSNPQEDAITIPGFTATAVAAQTLTADAATVPVFTLSTATLPEGYTLANARVALTPQGATTATEVSATMEGLASKDNIQSLIEAAYGKNPVARTFSGHVYVNAVKSGQAVLIDAGTVNYTVTAVTPDIANAYYIIGGPNSDWAASAASRSLKFTHSETNIYDDPVFTIVFPIADASKDCWFAIADDKACDAIVNSDDWTQLFGIKEGNGQNATDGTAGQLDRRAKLTDDGSLKVPAGTKYARVEINMLESTYKVTALNFAEYIYERGANTSWGDKAACPLALVSEDGKYQGFMYLNGELKFMPNSNNWEGDWENNGEGKIADNGGSNCPAPETGFYAVNVDLTAMTYSLDKVSVVSLIGDFSDDGWKTDIDLAYNPTSGAWEGDGVVLAKTGDLKFRMNHDWKTSWGGTLDKLTSNNGANINVEAGTYDVKLYLSCEGKHYATLTKK